MGPQSRLLLLLAIYLNQNIWEPQKEPVKSLVDECVQEKVCIRNVLEKLVLISFTAAGLLTGFITHGISCTDTRDCTAVLRMPHNS